jgi:hypothetical protein
MHLGSLDQVSIFDEHGSVNRPLFSPSGRSRTITLTVLKAIHTLYESEPDLYLDELVLWLGINHDIAISTLALHQNLKQAGLTRKLLHKIALERDQEIWQQWKEMQQGGDFLQDGSQIVCLDKTSKNELTWARCYGRAACGERAELTDVFIRGDWYSLLAALTIDGYIATEVVPGSFDSISFYEFVQEKVVCSFCVEHGNYQAHALFVKLHHSQQNVLFLCWTTVEFIIMKLLLTLLEQQVIFCLSSFLPSSQLLLSYRMPYFVPAGLFT